MKAPIRNKRKKFSKKACNSLLTFIITLPLLVTFMTYFIASFTFEVSQRTFSKVSDSYFDNVLVEGQLTVARREELLDELEACNFDKSKIEIRSSAPEVIDASDATYVPRGNTIEMVVVYNEQHPFGKLLAYLSGTPNNQVGRLAFKGYGMSEAVN